MPTETIDSLLKSSAELEKAYRKVLADKNVFDDDVSNLRSQLRECYEKIIYIDPVLASTKDLETTLWKSLFYKVIEEYRKKIRSIQNSLNNSKSSSTSNLSHTQLKKQAEQLRSEQRKLHSLFRTFVQESTGFYHNLISNLIIKYKIEYECELFPENEDGNTESLKEKPSKIQKADDKNDKDFESKRQYAMLTCFRSLIYLGDLARYREQLNDKPVKTYAVAKSYYKEALTIAPEHGNPHNQLAVVATYLQDELSAVYHYYRSLIVRQPFLTAKDNLGLLFQQSLKKFFSTLESSGDGVQSELERKDSKYSESKLSDGLDGLADDTRADQEALEKLTKKFISSLVNVQGLIYLKKNLDKLPNLASDTLHHFRRLLHHRALAAPQLLMITITSLSSMYGILYIDEKLAPSLPKSKPQQSKSESSSTSAATTSPELLQSARNLALKFVLEMALILVNVSNDAFMRPPSPTEKDDSEELVGIPPIVKRILPSLKIMTAWLGFSIDEIPSYLNSSSPPSSSTSSASSDTSAALSTDDSSSQSVSSTVATLLIQILQSYRTLTKHLKTVRDTLSVPPETDIQKLHFPQSTAYMVQAFTPLKEDYEIFGFKPMQKYLDAISFLEPSSPSTTSTPTSNPTSEKTSTATRSDSVSTGQTTPTPTSSVSCILPLSTLKSALTRRKLVFAALTPYQEALIRIHTIIASTEMMIPKLKDVVAKLDKDAVIPASPKKSGVTGLPEAELNKFKFNGSNGPFDLPTSAETVATGQRSYRQGEMKTHRGSDRRGLTEDGEVDEDQIFAALVSNVAKRGLDDDDKADNSREDEILFRPGRNQSVSSSTSLKSPVPTSSQNEFPVSSAAASVQTSGSNASATRQTLLSTLNASSTIVNNTSTQQLPKPITSSSSSSAIGTGTYTNTFSMLGGFNSNPAMNAAAGKNVSSSLWKYDTATGTTGSSQFNLPSVKQLINSNEPASSLPPPPAQATHRNSLSSIWGFNESIQNQPSGHQSNIIDNQSNSQSYSQVQQLQALSSLFQPLPSGNQSLPLNLPPGFQNFPPPPQQQHQQQPPQQTTNQPSLPPGFFNIPNQYQPHPSSQHQHQTVQQQQQQQFSNAGSFNPFSPQPNHFMNSQAPSQQQHQQQSQIPTNPTSNQNVSMIPPSNPAFLPPPAPTGSHPLFNQPRPSTSSASTAASLLQTLHMNSQVLSHSHSQAPQNHYQSSFSQFQGLLQHQHQLPLSANTSPTTPNEYPVPSSTGTGISDGPNSSTIQNQNQMTTELNKLLNLSSSVNFLQQQQQQNQQRQYNMYNPLHSTNSVNTNGTPMMNGLSTSQPQPQNQNQTQNPGLQLFQSLGLGLDGLNGTENVSVNANGNGNGPGGWGY